jgi:hypothetical protein
MKLSRRNALKSLAAAPFVRFPPDDARLAALAETVLPSEADGKAALASFLAWIEGYQEGADTDHGYGNTRIRATGASPGHAYPAQLDALDAAARASGAAGFAAASAARRRAIVEAAIAGAKIDRLPARPNGGHVATDLMAHYFGSSAANDLCYRAAIGRDACRGLVGSDVRPRTLR